MTLHAITEDGRIISPYRMIGDSPVHEIYQDIRKEQLSSKFFCYECYAKQGALEVVRFRGTNHEKVRPHFAHSSDDACPNKATGVESERHIAAKTVIGHHLEIDGFTVEPEKFLGTDASRHRRPDVVAHRSVDGVVEIQAHEIQLSPITCDELDERTENILAHFEAMYPDGIATVHWYLGRKNQNPEHLSWAKSTFQTKNYGISFGPRDGLDHYPTWVPLPTVQDQIDEECKRIALAQQAEQQAAAEKEASERRKAEQDEIQRKKWQKQDEDQKAYEATRQAELAKVEQQKQEAFLRNVMATINQRLAVGDVYLIDGEPRMITAVGFIFQSVVTRVARVQPTVIDPENPPSTTKKWMAINESQPKELEFWQMADLIARGAKQ